MTITKTDTERGGDAGSVTTRNEEQEEQEQERYDELMRRISNRMADAYRSDSGPEYWAQEAANQWARWSDCDGIGTDVGIMMDEGMADDAIVAAAIAIVAAANAAEAKAEAARR